MSVSIGYQLYCDTCDTYIALLRHLKKKVPETNEELEVKMRQLINLSERVQNFIANSMSENKRELIMRKYPLREERSQIRKPSF